MRQFHVVDRGLAVSDDTQSHDDTFEYGVKSGVVPQLTKNELVEL
jgi:hypothetical protein